MPLIALLIPFAETTPIVAIVACFLAVFILIPIRKEIHLQSVGWLTIGTILGVPIGVYFLKQITLQSDEVKQITESSVGLTLGLAIILFATYQLKKPVVFELKSNLFAIPVGIFTGILGGFCNTNGPPIVIYGMLKRWNPNQFRASLQAFFALSNFYIAFNHYKQGLWTERVLQLSAYAIPSLMLAVLVGYYLGKKIPTEKFSYLVYYFLIFVGLIFCGKSIYFLL